MKIKYWLDSGADSHSRFEDECDTEDIGFTAEEWAALSSEEKEELVRELAFQNSNWGRIEE